MDEPLKYMGHDLGIGACKGSSDCQCQFCKACTFTLNMLASLLAIVVDNKLVDIHNYLVVNCDSMFQRTAGLLASENNDKDNGGRTVH